VSGPALRVEGLGKAYRIGAARGGQATLRDVLVGWLRGGRAARSEILWALRDVSFTAERGEVVGVIGRNGAGKSTLLKVLARITEPTTGRATLEGRLGSLLEVGTGFHPELTGRENVYLSGAILGLRRHEIASRFDEIVAFSELERFLDTPVKRYSSGMYMRLAFAVAAHLQPEILLVDEVLAVGDAAFQRKCLGKMDEAARGGRTVLFVSHNLAAVTELCGRALLLDQGRLVADGPAAQVVGRYLDGLAGADRSDLSTRTERRGSQRLRFVGYALRDSRGASLPQAQSGKPLCLELAYETSPPSTLDGVQVSVAVHGRFDERLFYLTTLVAGRPLARVPARGRLVCEVPRLPLRPGRYSFTVICAVQDQLADWVENAGVIDVAPGPFFSSGKLPPEVGGTFLTDHAWRVTGEGGA
jgi:lipopolysaccharide transport system ATP-binding protein